LHGGKTPQGFALPQTTNGRYSKHLPTRMLATYDAAQADPDLLALNAEIALIDARLSDVLGRVDTGESGHIWQELKATYKELQDANRASDTQAARVALTEIGSLITRGHLDYAAWADVRTLIEQRRKLVESERKRLSEMQQMITSEQAMLLIARLYDSVTQHVSDRAVLAAIAADLGGLTAQATSANVRGTTGRNR
jgi:Spy/CpxP family protein refolding chaperone